MTKPFQIYTCLNQQTFSNQDYSIVPIRFNDRFDIMKWRNEQMYHLRQAKPLTSENQDNYFKTIVSELFGTEKPNQVLFSFLKNGVCIGYGGLVHINWIDKHAEISFVMNTKLEKSDFETNWTNYLTLIEKVSFNELGLRKIFTYAYDLRPHLFTTLENNNYTHEATLKDHCFFNNQFVNVLIHTKYNPLFLRLITADDSALLFDWVNDEDVRANSFTPEKIELENHNLWLNSKLNSKESIIFILEKDDIPVGQIRFDLCDSYWEIDYSISKSHRGKGLGSSIIKLGIAYLNKKNIKAKVKNSNFASQNIFEKLGFTKSYSDSIYTYTL